MLEEFIAVTAEPQLEYIRFECFWAATGDTIIKFENGVELMVSDLSHYYELSSEWMPDNDVEDDVTNSYKGVMPRDDYAKLCVEHAEWAAL